MYLCCIFQFISECHNAYDYYGESDAETGLDVESLAAPDSGESQSSVIMSEICMEVMLYHRKLFSWLCYDCVGDKECPRYC